MIKFSMYIKSNETKNILFVQGDEDVGYAVAFSNVHLNKKSQHFSVPYIIVGHISSYLTNV